jgi:hypothetical protein
MLATATEYERNCAGAVRINWAPGSLKAFGTSTVEELARDFGLKALSVWALSAKV